MTAAFRDKLNNEEQMIAEVKPEGLGARPACSWTIILISSAGNKRKGKKQWKGKLDLSRGKNIKAKLVARERERASHVV